MGNLEAAEEFAEFPTAANFAQEKAKRAFPNYVPPLILAQKHPVKWPKKGTTRSTKAVEATPVAKPLYEKSIAWERGVALKYLLKQVKKSCH